MKDNKLVIFVGAGISKNSGYPDWGQLINTIKSDLGLFENKKEENGEKEENDYLKIAQFYYNQWGEKQCYDLLNSIFLSKNYEPNPLHEKIFELEPNHIITTNYDN